MAWTEEQTKEYNKQYRQKNKDRQKELHKKWREANRAHVNEQARKQYELNKETRRAIQSKSAKKIYDNMSPEQKAAYAARQKASRLRRKYNLTPSEWMVMFASQGNSCAICKTKDPGLTGWATDHCHSSGHVRGILCQSCNKALGYAKDNAATLRAMLAYILRHQE